MDQINKEEIAKEIEEAMSKMTPQEQLKFVKEINESLAGVKESTENYVNKLKEVRDEVKADEFLKKAQGE